MSGTVVNYDAPELEKHGRVEHLERTVSDDSDIVNNNAIDALTPEEQKKVIRRIDRRLVLNVIASLQALMAQRANHSGRRQHIVWRSAMPGNSLKLPLVCSVPGDGGH